MNFTAMYQLFKTKQRQHYYCELIEPSICLHIYSENSTLLNPINLPNYESTEIIYQRYNGKLLVITSDLQHQFIQHQFK